MIHISLLRLPHFTIYLISQHHKHYPSSICRKLHSIKNKTINQFHGSFSPKTTKWYYCVIKMTNLHKYAYCGQLSICYYFGFVSLVYVLLFSAFFVFLLFFYCSITEKIDNSTTELEGINRKNEFISIIDNQQLSFFFWLFSIKLQLKLWILLINRTSFYFSF